MTLQGKRITGVRHLTEDEVGILGHFPHYRDTIASLEVESGEQIFPSKDDEGNAPGTWELSEEALEKLVGDYVVGFDESSDVYYKGLDILVGDAPTIEESSHVQRVGMVDEGAGPPAWFVRDDTVEGGDPDEVPTPMEVMEKAVSEDLSDEEYEELVALSEATHNGVTFSTIM